MMHVRGQFLATFLAAALAACAAPQRAADEARGTVRREVDERLGMPQQDEVGMVAEERVRELCAGGLDEDEAVRVTLLSNRALTARYAELGVSAAELEQTRLWANPVLEVGLLFFGDGTQIDLGLSQSFVDVFLRPRRAAVAEHELDGARARVARDVVGHVFATRRAHVTVLAARARFELESRHAAALEASVELVRRLHVAGNVTATDVALEEAALAARLLTRSAAELAFVAARESLSREMGVWGDLLAFEITGELRLDAASGLDLERVESRAVTASLDLAEGRSHMHALAQAVGVAELDARLPEAQIGLMAEKDHGESDWGLGPHAAIGIPLGDAGSTRGFGARARLAAAEAMYWSRAVEIRSRARTLRERLRALAGDARFARDVLVPAEQQVVLETLRNYNAMQVGVFDVLRAQGAELAAERRAVTLAAKAAQARLDLEELLAGSANGARADFDGQETNEAGPDTARGGH